MPPSWLVYTTIHRNVINYEHPHTYRPRRLTIDVVSIEFASWMNRGPGFVEGCPYATMDSPHSAQTTTFLQRS